MNSASRVLLGAGLALIATSAAAGDWFPGDPYKMHFPQLPDPMGWDVNATYPKVLADDWECTESGPVTDIHFWGSWADDIPGQIISVHVSIHTNVPAGPDFQFSHPGDLLWERDFDPSLFAVVAYGEGDEGWFDPNTGQYLEHNHMLYHQINITDIRDPFYQEVGGIYWLDVSVMVESPAGALAMWGWKTSQDHFMDDAVWSDVPTPGRSVDGALWNELFDPITGESLDLAFVITPTPGTLVLLGIGGVLAAQRRRR
jgi:hypothetical protein